MITRPLRFAAALALVAAFAVVVVFERTLWRPMDARVATLEDWRPAAAVRILDREGGLVEELGPKHRWVPLERVPPHVIDAFVAAEDRRFWSHPGVDVRGLMRAAWADLRGGRLAQGGSTLTQQLVKLTVVGDAPTLERKVREMVGALALERRLPKERILETWLNAVYLGGGATGLEAGARTWFGVGADELTVDQAALLASLVPAPSARAPSRDPVAARARRDAVLRAMVETGALAPDEAEAAMARPLGLVGAALGPELEAAAYRTEVRRWLSEHLGERRGGLEVHTALDPVTQALAERAVRRAVDLADRRVRRRERLPERAVGEPPLVQGAAVVLETATGEVLAVVGGYSDVLGGFVRATRARRQPGSAFKPFVYAAALEDGKRPRDPVVDEPVWFPGKDGLPWSPANHLDVYRGPMTLRDALVVSSNTVAVSLADQVGLEAVTDVAHRAGVRTPLRSDLSLALGASEVTPLELAVGYATIAAGGVRRDPVWITAVTDADGNVLAVAGEALELDGRRIALPGGRSEHVLGAPIAGALTSMLRAVVEHGSTGVARPAQERAGKTGTSNDYRDAWFVGYTPRHTIAVWVGGDDRRSLGATGGRIAAPAWAEIADGLGTLGTAGDPERIRPTPPDLSADARPAARGSAAGL